jgi:beta-lactamase regulating signal transducer with metallopeptidase domain
MIDSASLMQALAWSLLHFLWQGAVIAALAAAIMFAYRKPAARYLVGVGALVLMLGSFAVTFSLIDRSPAAVESTGAAMPAIPAIADFGAGTSYSGLESDRPSPAVGSASPGSDMLWIARGWLVGVFGFALRMACGLLLIEHLRRRNLIALPAPLVERFQALQVRLGIRRAIRYCECRLLGVPAVVGIFRPIVLLPVRALTGLTPEQLDAVIAHELAHVKRFDVAVNFVQVAAETLFFFHPAVWWLNKRIRADREDCCDDAAIEACGGTVGYARALATMETWRAVPDFAMAATGSPVAARVARLLGVRQNDASARTASVVTTSLVLATALIAGVISIGVTTQALAQADPAGPMVAPTIVPPAPPAAPQPMVDEQPAANARPAVAAQPAVSARPAASAQPALPARLAKPPRPPKLPRNVEPERTGQVEHSGSYIQDMKDVGLSDLDADHLIALRSQNVTPDYVRAMRGSGLDPDVDSIISMKVMGVTPDYVKEVRALGFKPDAGELVAMKAQGMTAEYVKGLRDLGVNPDANELIAMKVQGITPEYVRQMRAAGFDPDNQQLIAMKVQDVTVEYRRALEAAGYKLDVSETIAAKVMDITPEFIAKVHAMGFKNLTIDKLIQLKNADIF